MFSWVLPTASNGTSIDKLTIGMNNRDPKSGIAAGPGGKSKFKIKVNLLLLGAKCFKKKYLQQKGPIKYFF